MEKLLRQVLDRLDVLERKIDTLDDKFTKLSVQETTKKEKNAMRRQMYREERERKLSGKIPLPAHHCLEKRDGRVDFRVFVDKGVEFGKANQPYKYLTWIVHHWNTKLYLLPRSGGLAA